MGKSCTRTDRAFLKGERGIHRGRTHANGAWIHRRTVDGEEWVLIAGAEHEGFLELKSVFYAQINI